MYLNKYRKCKMREIITLSLSPEYREKLDIILKTQNVTVRSVLIYITNMLIEKFVYSKDIVYDYVPLKERNRKKLSALIDLNFKSRAEFAKQSKLSPYTVSSILNNMCVGSFVVWSKISDTFERLNIKIPNDLKIKRKVEINYEF